MSEISPGVLLWHSLTDEHLRRLLRMAEEVGVAKREWQEAVERSASVGRHPTYEDKAAAEKLYYQELRAALYQTAGIPETEEEPPERENSRANC